MSEKKAKKTGLICSLTKVLGLLAAIFVILKKILPLLNNTDKELEKKTKDSKQT